MLSLEGRVKCHLCRVSERVEVDALALLQGNARKFLPAKWTHDGTNAYCPDCARKQKFASAPFQREYLGVFADEEPLGVEHGYSEAKPRICPDGGTCHHGCTSADGCWRKDAGCAPLSASGLDDNWRPRVKHEWRVSLFYFKDNDAYKRIQDFGAALAGHYSSTLHADENAFELLCEANRIHASPGGWYFDKFGTLILTGWRLQGYEYTAPEATPEKPASSPAKAPEPEESYVECALTLASLEGHEVCGRCGAFARAHRNWIETQRKRGIIA